MSNQGEVGEDASRPPRRIAVVPAYNEETTVTDVLSALHPVVDELIVVNDGSTDGTAAVLEDWVAGRERVQLLSFPVNRGMSAAYYEAFSELRRRRAAGSLADDDLVFTIDADGQHDLSVLTGLESAMTERSLHAMLARRDLSYHGPFKLWGNRVVSAWASLWAGCRLHDVESGYRIFRLGALAHSLAFYRGYRYSETVQVAVVLGRLGYRVANDVVVPVPVSRSRTRMVDAVIDVAAIPWAAIRVLCTRRKVTDAYVGQLGSQAD